MLLNRSNARNFSGKEQANPSWGREELLCYLCTTFGVVMIKNFRPISGCQKEELAHAFGWSTIV
jgi:hypothetical protein